jgi:Glycosyl hydrolases family 16
MLPTQKRLDRGARAAVRQRRRRALPLVAAAALVTLLTTVVAAPGSFAAARASSSYPIGVFDEYEPSGFAPPAANQLPGYTEAYVDDFTQPLDFTKWGRFSGVPKGDPAGYFERGHVFTTKGVLRIGTWRDPSRDDHWATGGICLCGVHPTYGAFFVRSRETAAGPDDAELLWPSDNSWPPELDFNETGTSPKASSWTDHYTSPTIEVQQTLKIDVLHWHTWGIVWTPSAVTFVVDGRVWGQVTSAAQIPDLPMTLDLQQQTWCGIEPECPTKPSSMLIDWVVVYTPTG